MDDSVFSEKERQRGDPLSGIEVVGPPTSLARPVEIAGFAPGLTTPGVDANGAAAWIQERIDGLTDTDTLDVNSTMPPLVLPDSACERACLRLQSRSACSSSHHPRRAERVFGYGSDDPGRFSAGLAKPLLLPYHDLRNVFWRCAEGDEKFGTMPTLCVPTPRSLTRIIRLLAPAALTLILWPAVGRLSPPTPRAPRRSSRSLRPQPRRLCRRLCRRPRPSWRRRPARAGRTPAR